MLELTQFSDTLTPRLEAAVAAHLDFTPAMAVIADYLRDTTVERFETETGPDGQRWQPSQRAREEGGLTLTKSGELRLSIDADSSATEALVGTNKIYAAIHQFGGTIRPQRARALSTPFGPRASVQMPARPFIGFTPADVARVEETLAAHITAAFEGGTA
jgi:phage virion morphogenesis protein